MRVLKKRLILWGAVLGLTTAGVAPAQEPSLLEKLFRLVWPVGRFDGDLATAVVRNTEKSGASGGIPALYAVDAANHSWTELAKTRGSADGTVCPDGQALFYRRKTSLYRQGLELGPAGLGARGEPSALEGVASVRLFGCVKDGANQVALWAETADHQVRLLRPAGTGWTWSDVPSSFAPPAPSTIRDVAEQLVRLRSLRPDGTRVWVRDRRLVQETKTGKKSFVVSGSSPLFRGIPVWVGDSNYLVVAGSEAGQ